MLLLGNDKACRVASIGSIRFILASGQKNIINGVRYVPELKRNHISIGMLDKQGYTINANDEVMKVSRGSMTMLNGKLRNGIYILDGKSVTGIVDIAVMDETTVWHRRLGHMSERGSKC